MFPSMKFDYWMNLIPYNADVLRLFWIHYQFAWVANYTLLIHGYLQPLNSLHYQRRAVVCNIKNSEK
jgi:hypothetical protein